jgi:hypothetical protein
MEWHGQTYSQPRRLEGHPWASGLYKPSQSHSYTTQGSLPWLSWSAGRTGGRRHAFAKRSNCNTPIPISLSPAWAVALTSHHSHHTPIAIAFARAIAKERRKSRRQRLAKKAKKAKKVPDLFFVLSQWLRPAWARPFLRSFAMAQASVGQTLSSFFRKRGARGVWCAWLDLLKYTLTPGRVPPAYNAA